MAGGETGRGNGAKRAVVQHDLHGRAVIGVQDIVADPPPAPCRRFSGCTNGLGILPGDEGREVRIWMPTSPRTPWSHARSRPATAISGRSSSRPRRLGQPALQIDASKWRTLPMAPARTMAAAFAAPAPRGRQVHHVHHAGFGGHLRHRLGMGGIGGQRLFAQDVLARRQHRNGGRVMRAVGVTFATASNSPHASASSTEPKPRGILWVALNSASCAGGYRRPPPPRRRDRGEVGGVVRRHPAGPKDQHPHHQRYPFAGLMQFRAALGDRLKRLSTGDIRRGAGRRCAAGL